MRPYSHLQGGRGEVKLFHHWSNPRLKTSTHFNALLSAPHAAKHSALLSRASLIGFVYQATWTCIWSAGSRPVNISARWTRIYNRRAALCVTVNWRSKKSRAGSVELKERGFSKDSKIKIITWQSCCLGQFPIFTQKISSDTKQPQRAKHRGEHFENK